MENGLVSLVGDLAVIPDKLSSPQKRTRQYWEGRCSALLVSVASCTVDLGEKGDLDYDPLIRFLSEYRQFLMKGDYTRARREALEFVRFLRS